jgi:hypothetical protein
LGDDSQVRGKYAKEEVTLEARGHPGGQARDQEPHPQGDDSQVRGKYDKEEARGRVNRLRKRQEFILKTKHEIKNLILKEMILKSEVNRLRKRSP